jgi:DNA invertase Pin-like site-specific DNA recombinase
MKPKMPQDGISGFTSAVDSATIIASPKILRLMMLNHIVRRLLLIEARTNEASKVIAHTRGKKIAKAKGRLRGKQPKLSPKQEAHLAGLHASGEYTMSELAKLFSVGRSTVYRAVERVRQKAAMWAKKDLGRG